MKKFLTIENCFDRLPEGCLIIPPLPYIALHDFDIDIDATDRQSQKLFTVELRTKGRVYAGMLPRYVIYSPL